MTDRLSDKAYDELKAKNSVEHDQLSVLNIFRKAGQPLTARDAFNMAHADGLSINFNGVRSRITELTDKEMLEKYDKATDSETGKTVNRWRVKVLSVQIMTDFFLPNNA